MWTIQSRKRLITWWQEFNKMFLTALLEMRQENKIGRALQVNHNFSVRTPLRQLMQTKFSWPFNRWWRTVIQQISTTTSRESRNCPNPSQRQFPGLTAYQKISNSLKTCSKNVWKIRINLRKETKKLPSLAHVLWCTTNLQKQQEHQRREVGRIFD